MSYLLLAILSIVSFIKKNSKVVFSLLLSYAITIFCFNTHNPDLYNYVYHYQLIDVRKMEPLYTFLEWLFRTLHFDYIYLRVFLCVLGMILLTKTIWDFSPYPNVVLLLYIIYPFSLDVVQVRSFVANAIVLFSIRYVIYYSQNKNKSSVLKFIVCVLLATGFHYAAILYSVILVSLFQPKKQNIIFLIITPIIIFILANINVLSKISEGITGTENTSGWLTLFRLKTPIQIFRLISTRGLVLLMIAVWQKVINMKQEVKSDYINRKQNIVAAVRKTYFEDHRINMQMYYCILYITLFTVLEIYISSEFERLHRVAMILQLVLITRQIHIANSKNKVIMWGVSLIAFLLYFISIMISLQANSVIYFDHVFRAVFENNLLF